MSTRIALPFIAAAFVLAVLAPSAAATTVTTSPGAPGGEGLVLAYDAASDAGSYGCTHGTGAAVETGNLPLTLVNGETTYLTFDIPDTSLEPGRQYGFLIGFTGGGHVNNARLDVLHLGEDAYPDGVAVEDAPGVSRLAYAEEPPAAEAESAEGIQDLP